jgi:hypothetical protein
MSRFQRTLRIVVLSNLLFAFTLSARGGDATTNRLQMRFPASESKPWFSADAPEDAVVLIQSTTNFAGWQELLRGHGPIPWVPDFSASSNSTRFLRARFQEKTEEDDWKNVLRDGDAFRSPEPPSGNLEPRWVKFAILLHEPGRVIFQDSSKYAFHYDFAHQRIPQFAKFTRLQFDSATLHTNNQQAVLGAILFPPTTNLFEVGIQFVGFDPYPRESVAEWFETVRAMLGLSPAVQAFYLPTFEQRETALQNTAWFAERGITISSVDRWVIADQIYAPGWALGRLVFVPANQITDAYRVGTLKPADILLTDAVPAEVPPLAGIITLTPATPNSHVALLARSFGIPFIYVAQPDFPERVMSWNGREVLMRAVEGYAEHPVLVTPVAAPLPEAIREQLKALKAPPKLNLPAKSDLGAISVSTVTLQPSDIRFVGGKAANYGILRRSIPTNCPTPAIAFTFGLWDAYLDQMLPNGQTLRGAIAERLEPFSWPPDIAALQTALAEIRKLITDSADFSPDQQAAILQVLQSAGFEPTHNIRFRSSTNVEDSEQFSGAGLYDSFSGCLADDLDSDNAGPSTCDPSEGKERGVFRALRKVYASFYNDNAVLERLRHSVTETNVGMAVLVHYSTPDEFELANGVATLAIRHHGPDSWEIRTRLVTQLGAISVTNPDSAARPEEVQVVEFASSSRPFLSVSARSSLVPLGDTVLQWEQEYAELYGLLKAAAQKWQQELGTNQFTILDFEYKKEQPGKLSIKQIRPLPLPPIATQPAPYVISTTNRYVVLQGEFGDVISNHRLKSAWGIATRNLHWSNSNLTSSVVAGIDAEFRLGTNTIRLAGPLNALPDYSFTRETDYTEDKWNVLAGSDRLQFYWRVYDLAVTGQTVGPLAVLEDHRLQFAVTYPTAQAALNNDDFSITNTMTDQVWITPVMPLNADRKRQERSFQARSLNIATTFYWPDEPRETGAGYTAPLLAWVGTTIEGLTSTPITLLGDYSQTYRPGRPGHHNASEDFVFDPWLEPGLSGAQLAELAAANIRAIIVRRGRPITPVNSGIEDAEDIFLLWGLDGAFRKL